MWNRVADRQEGEVHARAINGWIVPNPCDAIREGAQRRTNSAPANRVGERLTSQYVCMWSPSMIRTNFSFTEETTLAAERAAEKAAEKTTPPRTPELQQCVEQLCAANARTPAIAPTPEQAEASSERPASVEEDQVSQTASDERQGATASDDFDVVTELSVSFSESDTGRISQDARKYLYVKAAEMSDVP